MPVAQGHFGHQETIGIFRHAHVLHVRRHGIGREGANHLHRIVQQGDVVAGVDADTQVFTAVVLQDSQHVADGPVLVVLERHRHLVPLQDRDGPLDGGVRIGHELLPVL